MSTTQVVAAMNAATQAKSGLVVTTDESNIILSGHYTSHSSSSYEASFFYSPSVFTKFVRDHVTHTFGLHTTTLAKGAVAEHAEEFVLLDVGGGTGNFTQMLLKEDPGDEHGSGKVLNKRGIVLEPFLEKSDVIDAPMLEFIRMGAEVLKEDVGDSIELSWRRRYNACLMKEVVHHFDAKDRVGIFRGICDDLKRNKSASAYNKMTVAPDLLIITRPQRDIDYPFYSWEQVREVWAENQPAVEDIEDDLVRAGFGNVRHTMVPFECSCSINQWVGMVKGRLWSTFSHFSDDELEEACQLILREFLNAKEGRKDTATDDDIVTFEERLLFVSGCS